MRHTSLITCSLLLVRLPMKVFVLDRTIGTLLIPCNVRLPASLGPDIIKTIANATQVGVGADKMGLGFKGGWPSCGNNTLPSTCLFDDTARATIDYVRLLCVCYISARMPTRIGLTLRTMPFIPCPVYHVPCTMPCAPCAVSGASCPAPCALCTVSLPLARCQLVPMPPSAPSQLACLRVQRALICASFSLRSYLCLVFLASYRAGA